MKTKHIKLVLILLLILVMPTILLGQDRQYMFKHLDKEDGLSNNNITTFLRDSKGFLWIGTSDGLNRYDGYSIKTFRTIPGDSNSIQNNKINFLAEDYNKNIWIGNGDYLNIYNPYLNTFRKADSLFNNKLAFVTETKWKLIKDRYSHYWYLSSKQGLFKYNVKQDSLIKVLDISSDIESAKRHQLTDICEDSKGNIWCTNATGKIYKIDNITTTIVDSIQLALGNDLFFPQIFIDNDNDIWFHESNNNLLGIFWIKNNNSEIIKLHTESNPVKLSSNLISGIEQGSNGNIWISTDHGGLNIINKKTSEVHYIASNTTNKRSIAENTITNIYYDYEGYMWIGTFKKGTSFYHDDLFKFDHYKINLPGEQSARLNDIDNFVEDELGNIWIGTNGSGLFYYNRQNNSFKQYKHNPANKNSLSSDVIIGLTRDRHNNIWIGTYMGGLNKWDGKKFTNFLVDTTKQGTITDNRIWDIYEDDEGLLWLATLLGGINVFDPKTNKVVNVYKWEGDNSIKSNVVFTIIQDKDGLIWCATVDGIRSFDKKNQKFTYYEHSDSDTTTLSDNMVYDIIEDSRGLIWVATANGLNYLDKNDQTIKRIYQKDGLVDNFILTVIEDDNSDIWVSTSNGLSKIRLQKNLSNGKFKCNISSYRKLDGLQGSEFNEKAAYKTSKGELIFGGGNGYNLFNPNDIKTTSISSNIVFTDFLLFNKSVNNKKIVNGRYILKNDITFTDTINLKYDENLFTIEFSNLDFFYPERKRYKYRLQGFNNNWIEISGKNRRITYTNLNPGEYKFTVLASNTNNSWEKRGKDLIIIIQPPWWKTLWFKLIAIFLIIAVPSSFYLWRVTELTTQRKLLKQKVNERTKELTLLNSILKERQEEISLQNEELNLHRDQLENLVKERTSDLEKALKKAEESDDLKSAFLSNISHEVRTPMNAIVGFSHLLLDDELETKEKTRYVQTIQKNCDSLLTFIDDILDISKIQSNQIVIYKRNFDVIKLMLELENYYRFKSDYDVDIICDYNKEYKEFIINNDNIRIKQVIQNLINNALKFTEKGHVRFGFNLIDTNRIQFFIEDTGIGIATEKFNNVFKPFGKIEKNKAKLHRGAGLGLAISKHISDLMDGELRFESMHGQGTTFYFTIPFDNVIKAQSVQESQSEPDVDFSENQELNILVAEDELMNFQLIEDLFSKYKIQLTWARNGQQAVNYIKEQPLAYHLVLMDIKMPVLDGIEALKQIQKINRNMPVIALTAYAYADEKVVENNEPFFDYLTKPINPNDVFMAIEKASRIKIQLK